MGIFTPGSPGDVKRTVATTLCGTSALMGWHHMSPFTGPWGSHASAGSGCTLTP